MIWKWWLSCPRHIGTPSKIVCKTRRDLINAYNLMNGNTKKCYVGLYACDENGSHEKVTLDVVGVDLDDRKGYEYMVELHDRLLSLGWIHQVSFSTGGFWVYVKCEPRTYNRSLAKMKLEAMQNMIIADTSLFFGDAHQAPVDKAIRGDVVRLTRFPSSYDKERKRYAVFLNEDMIRSGYDNICIAASKEENRFNIYTFGEKVGIDPDTVKHSTIAGMHTDAWKYGEKMLMSSTVAPLPEGITEEHKNILDSLPDFMQLWVVDPEVATWQARAYITLFLRERGLSKSMVESFLKPFYSQHPRTDSWKNNWNHYMKAARCSESIFRNLELKFPSYRTLYDLGLCPYEYVEKYGQFASPAYR